MQYAVYESVQEAEIVELFRRTFSDSEGEKEGKLVGCLAKDLIKLTEGDDVYIFIALDGKRIVGCIMFSRLGCEDGTLAFLLSPVAVLPAYQRQGIGKGLISFGLEAMRKMGVALVVTYGDIRFYTKTGFGPLAKSIVAPPFPLTFPEGWLGRTLDGSSLKPIHGKISCVAALNEDCYW